MLFLQTYDKLSVWKVWNFSENLQTTIQHNQYHRVAITVITNTVSSKKSSLNNFCPGNIVDKIVPSLSGIMNKTNWIINTLVGNIWAS